MADTQNEIVVPFQDQGTFHVCNGLPVTPSNRRASDGKSMHRGVAQGVL